jgi:predicted ATP-binding protein involved in virulence
MALAPTLRRSGELVTRFAQLKQWIVNIDFIRAKAKADRNEESPLWDHLHRALNTFFAPYVFDRVDERFEVWFHSPTGRIRLEALSDGFRSLFVIITELLLRMSLATTDMQQLPFQEAVCLIDEIDAHLHPAWQERIVPTLRQLFPNVQFIATTHSPLVVSSVEPHEVFELEETP